MAPFFYFRYMEVPFVKAMMENDLLAATEILAKEPSLADHRNEQGLSALTLAAYWRNTDMIDLLLQHKQIPPDPFEAAALGNLELVQAVPAEKINAFAPDGFTLLGLASFFGYETIVEWLLGQGAQVNLPANNHMRVCPLHSAVAAGHDSVVKMLLQAGADVNALQMTGITALHSAAHNSHFEIAKMLLEHGADKMIKTEDGYDAAWFAKDANATEILELLSNP